MWLLPTLNRIDKLNKFIDMALETKMSTPVTLLVDENDMSSHADDYLKITERSGVGLVQTKAVGMGDKVREWFASEHYDEATQFVGLLNDDHAPITEGWDKLLVSKLDGTNFVSPNDRQPDRRAFMLPTTATAWSVDLIEAVGFPIYPTNMKHLFVDTLWLQLGKATGCWRMCANVIVEHHHVLWGKAPSDETHEKVYAKPAWDYDEFVFKQFMANDFQATVQKIRALQGLTPSQKYNASPPRPKQHGVVLD